MHAESVSITGIFDSVLGLVLVGGGSGDETHSPAATPMLFSPPVHPDSVKALMNASVAADPMVSAPTTTEIEKRMFAWLN